MDGALWGENGHWSISASHPVLSWWPIKHIQTIFPICMDLIVQMAKRGLVHCDFNEFNLMINQAGVVTLIDFPQVWINRVRVPLCVHLFFTYVPGFNPLADDLYLPSQCQGDVRKGCQLCGQVFRHEDALRPISRGDTVIWVGKSSSSSLTHTHNECMTESIHLIGIHRW